MKRIILSTILALLFSASGFAHESFKLVSSEKKIVKETEIANLEKSQTPGAKDKINLTFTQKEIRLVAVTGPEDDMLSYRIQGVRNPNLIIPSGATVRILFVNIDGDMPHDIRFGHIVGDFPVAPDVTETAGSQKLPKRAGDGAMQAEEIVIQAREDGAYKYFCSVRGHAKGGMWGNILVGVKPGDNLESAEKTVHVHSEDEEKEMNEKKTDEKKTDVKKPVDEMKDMKMDDKKPADMSDMKMDDKKSDDKMSDMPGMNMSSSRTAMPAVTDINVPMTQESSGTAWIPSSSPMSARMKMFGDGSMLMFHGNMFLRYTNTGSRRDFGVGGKGDNDRFDAPSMFMLMYSRPLTEKSQIGFRAMMSLDPIIERGYGYPLLYQSGETYRGEPIHDRQHPHDFFSELSATYSYRINDEQSFFLYAGYPGEPALGPPTFMHRLSAMNNPDAPLSHHWQDSTHVTFGVLTAGYNFGKFKLEASAFKGQEPNENRWDFDAPKLDSFSGRLSFNPNENWAFQISYGYLKNPEPSEPSLKILRRTTASAIYNKKFGADKNLAASFVWGQNYGNGERTNAFLFETDYTFAKNSIFGRAERVQKSGHELVLDEADHDEIFWVGEFSIGYLREIYKNENLSVGLGAQATFYQNPAALASYYGGTDHRAGQIFLRFRIQ
jgi:plastocyanin